MKQIKLSDTHYIVVDETQEIKVGDSYYHPSFKEIFRLYKETRHNKAFELEKAYKITHSTKPIERLSYDPTDVHQKGFLKIKKYPLSLAKEIAGEVDVEKKAKIKFQGFIDNATRNHFEQGFQEGYNQCLEDNKDKKYTEEDLRKAIFLYSAWIVGGAPSLRIAESPEQRIEQIIQSLQPPTEWEVEIIDGKLTRKK